MEIDLETGTGGRRPGEGEAGGGEEGGWVGDGGEEEEEAGGNQLLHLGSSWTRNWILIWRELRPFSINS